MNSNGSLVGGTGEAVAVLETIDLQQVAASDVGRVDYRVGLLCNIHTVWTYVNLVANLIGTHITAVEHHIHELVGGVELQAGKFSQSRCHCIANQRLVASISQQRPFLGLRIALAQKLLLV